MSVPGIWDKAKNLSNPLHKCGLPTLNDALIPTVNKTTDAQIQHSLYRPPASIWAAQPEWSLDASSYMNPRCPASMTLCFTQSQNIAPPKSTYLEPGILNKNGSGKGSLSLFGSPTNFWAAQPQATIFVTAVIKRPTVHDLFTHLLKLRVYSIKVAQKKALHAQQIFSKKTAVRADVIF